MSRALRQQRAWRATLGDEGLPRLTVSSTLSADSATRFRYRLPLAVGAIKLREVAAMLSSTLALGDDASRLRWRWLHGVSSQVKSLHRWQPDLRSAG
jgi:hypothetical protein